MFAPDGSLLQVEYAQEVAAKGAPAVAVVAADGRSVVLATVADDSERENDDDNGIEDNTLCSLVDMQSSLGPSSAHAASEKLMQLDDHVWVAVRFVISLRAVVLIPFTIVARHVSKTELSGNLLIYFYNRYICQSQVSGLRADGRVLVDRARQACQEYRLSYGEAPTVSRTLAPAHVCLSNIKQ